VTIRPILNNYRLTRYWPLCAAALVVTVYLAGCRQRTPAPETAEPTTATVERGTFVVSAVEDGALAALRQTTITSKQSGTIEWLAKEGTKVVEGDLLVEIDKKSLVESLEKNSVALKEAQTKLAELERDFEAQKKDLEQNVAAAEVELKLAEVKLKRLKDGPTPHDKAKARADLETAQLAAQQAESDHRRLLELQHSGIASRVETQQGEIEVKVTEASLKQAQYTHDRLLEGPPELELRSAELATRSARVSLSMAKEKLGSQIARLEGEIEEAEANVERLTNTEARLGRRIEQRTIKAPHRGTVIYYVPRWHSKPQIDVGSSAWAGGGIMELPDLRKMKVLTQVTEYHVRYVKVGDPVSVALPLLPDTQYTGKIIWIDGWGRDKNEKLDYSGQRKHGLSGINVFNVEVALDQEDERLKLGFEAKVRIPFKRIENALFVPRQAVTLSSRRPLVQVLTKGQTVERQITTGDQNEESIVVASGLEEGEIVIVHSDATDG